MRSMTTWTVIPGAVREAVDRFLANEGAPVAGVKLVERWHRADCSGGFVLYESDSPAAMFENAAMWADALALQTVVVVGDAEAGAAFAKVFKK
ncbi:MAG TPA: DUF3303 family protein [Terracidiphilus sp.]|nr:DUF3303 family protein [Terracidiphilus sp.]